MGNRASKPYDQRTDPEKIQTQWRKLSGLCYRGDWSAAVVRAATATEIALNFAIRREFEARSQLDPGFVDSLLKWANGLSGKLDRLLLPMLQDQPKQDAITTLCPLARAINDQRNDVVHRGKFCSEEEAKNLVKQCESFVIGVVRLYEPSFVLEEGSRARKAR